MLVYSVECRGPWASELDVLERQRCSLQPMGVGKRGPWPSPEFSYMIQIK